MFEKFGMWHGNLWLDKWAGFDVQRVKQEWSAELQAAHFSVERIKCGLESCKRNKYPPGLPEFIAACEAVPADAIQRLINQREGVKALGYERQPELSREEAVRRMQELRAGLARRKHVASRSEASE